MPDLSIEIKAKADSAIKSIELLETKLNGLNTALGNLQSLSQLSNLADGINQLSSAMSMLKSSHSAKDFSTLATNLQKITNINSAGIGQLATNLGMFVPTVQGLAGSNISGSVTRLVHALTSLAKADLTGLYNANFGAMGSELAQLTNALSETGDVSPKTVQLVNAIGNLASAGESARTVISVMPQLTKELVSFHNAMAKVGDISQQTVDLTSALASLASTGKKANLTADSLGKLGVQLNNIIVTLSKSPQVATNTVELVKALSQISNQGVRINASAGHMNRGLTSLIQPMKRVRKQTKSLASAFGMFYAKFFLIIRAIRGVWNSVKSAMDFIEVYNYFDAAISQVSSKAAKDWAEAGYESAEAYYDALYKKYSDEAKALTTKMSGYSLDSQGNLTREGVTNLGLDPKTMLNYQAQFAQLSSSMGVASDYAMKMSQALTEIGADLASVKNMEFKEVWDNMSSGIVGMSRAVDKYGVNIRNAAMQEKLYDLGIDVSITKLGQQDKALLRTIMILDSTRYAWADLADTIEQPANQMRMLKANLDSLARTLGSALLGSVASLLPYINALTIALQRLIQYIIDFFGIQLVSITSQSASNISDLLDSVGETEDALGSASGAADKLQKSLLGIDELNVINTNESGGVGAGGLGDYNDELQGAFDAIYDEYQKVWDKAYEDVENKAQKLADRICNAFKRGDYRAIGDYISKGLGNALRNIKWDKVYSFAKDTGKNFANFLNGLFNPETFRTVGKTIAGSLNTLLYAQGSFLETIEWKEIGKTIAEGINGFVDEIDTKQLAKNISTKIKGALQAVSSFLKNTDFKKIGEKIGEFIKELDWKGILAGIAEVIVSALSASIQAFAGSISVDPIGTLIVTALIGFFTYAKLKPVIMAISAVLGGASASATMTTAGATLGGGLISGITAKIAASGIGTILTTALTTDIGLIIGAGTIAEIGTMIGLSLVGGIIAAVAGYKIGEAIGNIIFSETEPLVPKVVENIKNAGVVSAEEYYNGLSEGARESLNNAFDVINAQTTPQAREAAIQYFAGLESGLDRTSLAALQAQIDFSSFGNTVNLITTRYDELQDKTDKAKVQMDLLTQYTQMGEQKFVTASGKLQTFEQLLEGMDTSSLNYDVDETSNNFEDLSNNALAMANVVTDSSGRVTTSFENLSGGIGNVERDFMRLSANSLTTLATLSNGVTEQTNTVKQGLENTFGVEAISTTLSSVPETFSRVFKNVANVVVGIMNKMIQRVNESMTVSWDNVNIGGEDIVKKGNAQLLRMKPIPQFSLGGFPEDGLFFANSNEMVGSFTNGRTAVANNSQIVAGIEQGVYNAMMSAMSSGQSNVNVTLEGGAEEIFRVVRNQNGIFKKQTGASAF